MPFITWKRRSVLAAALLTLSLAGCADDNPAVTSGKPTHTPTKTPTRAHTPTPSQTPVASETTPAPARSLEERLLPAADLPGFNEVFTWDLGTTESGDPESTSPCGGFGLFAIGAKSVAHRTYTPADGSTSTALEVVGDFPDVMTAKRAYSVLGSDFTNCPVDHEGDPHVGPFTPVVFDNGSVGGWHLLTYGTTFDAQGFVRRGKLIAQVVLVLNDAQDYDYPAGEEPMVAALQRAAALL